jgi:hypothetical protein
MKRQLSGLQNRFAVFSLFASSVMELPCARHEKSSQFDGILCIVCIPITRPHFSVLQANGIINDVCETAVYKEKRKDVRSQCKHNFSYLVLLYTAMITLNKEP